MLRGRHFLARRTIRVAIRYAILPFSIHYKLHAFQILSETMRCLATTSLEVEHLIILSLDTSPEEISDMLSVAPQRCRQTVLDCFSDPEGWFGRATIPQTDSNSQCINLKSLDNLARVLYNSLTTRSLVLIDALSTLTFRHDPSSVTLHRIMSRHTF